MAALSEVESLLRKFTDLWKSGFDANCTWNVMLAKHWLLFTSMLVIILNTNKYLILNTNKSLMLKASKYLIIVASLDPLDSDDELKEKLLQMMLLKVTEYEDNILEEGLVVENTKKPFNEPVQDTREAVAENVTVLNASEQLDDITGIQPAISTPLPFLLPDMLCSDSEYQRGLRRAQRDKAIEEELDWFNKMIADRSYK